MGSINLVVDDELGYMLGRDSGSCIEYWRKGNLPAKPDDVAQLASVVQMLYQTRLSAFEDGKSDRQTECLRQIAPYCYLLS